MQYINSTRHQLKPDVCPCAIIHSAVDKENNSPLEDWCSVRQSDADNSLQVCRCLPRHLVQWGYEQACAHGAAVAFRQWHFPSDILSVAKPIVTECESNHAIVHTVMEPTANPFTCIWPCSRVHVTDTRTCSLHALVIIGLDLSIQKPYTVIYSKQIES